jgi:hypothetical protein
MRSALTVHSCVDASAKTIFIDRNSGGKAFRNAITARGIHVVLHDDIFDRNEKDHIWLPAVAARGYIMVTGDRRTTHNLLFLRNLAASTAYVFILLELNGATGPKRADCIIQAYPLIQDLVKKTRSPAIWRIGCNCLTVTLVDHKRILADLSKRYRG